MGTKPKLKIVINSPVILSFTALCVIAFIIIKLTGNGATHAVFSVYRSSLLSPLTYVRFFGHVFGHGSVEHLFGNLMTILILGPMLEERYGGKTIVLVMAVTALITGLAHFILFTDTALMGASGIVFAFILLSSFTGFKDREIPLTFLLVAFLYLGQQIYQMIAIDDNVSQLTHILGGLTGSVLGYKLNKK
ncbi:MAG: rhomboid family intramembrane serine protease [Lachnospiraceae bacterium]|nr:rhomboid family intramembrane serine protease [Lachnospiraceae bacterium]